ncbi:hypothetical protein [Aminipila sp.]|uniref:hypothetical protein n=1 Tax=Aminipila sp. TaxID=2060095 RepID=UPI0028A2A9BF|nr:hypothetical protein [Aminipila sp.]
MNRDIEKFTYRDGTKWARAEYDCRIFEAQDEDGNDCFSGELIDRLAELEDKLEQGLMIELPCKIGTPIAYIQACQAPTCEICGCNNRYGDCVMEHKVRIRKDKFSLFFLNAFGESVFLTESEAQAELERRKSNE